MAMSKTVLAKLGPLLKLVIKLRKISPLVDTDVIKKILFGDENGESYIKNPQKLKELISQEAGLEFEDEDSEEFEYLPKEAQLLVIELIKVCCKLQEDVKKAEKALKPPEKSADNADSSSGQSASSPSPQTTALSPQLALGKRALTTKFSWV